MRIDGRPNQRACVTPARADLACARQNAFPSADVDLLAAADWLFPEGMDHHTMMTGSHTGNALFLKLVREMGGAGTLPDGPRATRLAPRDETLDVCVIGGGPAGLAAAHAIAEAAPGARVALYDEQATPGGSLLAEADGTARAAAMAEAARGAGAELVARATAIGHYPEDEGSREASDAASDWGRACWPWSSAIGCSACGPGGPSTRRAVMIRTCRSPTTIVRE